MSEKLVSPLVNKLIKSFTTRFSLFTLVMLITILSVSSLVFASIPGNDDLMALQGNIVDSVGNPINNGNLRVTIWSNATGQQDAVNLTNGTQNVLVYNSSRDFFGAIQNGRFDVMLGNGSQNLSLEFGRIYHLDMEINGVDLDFNGEERQMFQSSTGEVRGVEQANNGTAFYINKTSNAEGIALLVRNFGNGTGLEIIQNRSGGAVRTFAVLVRNATSIIYTLNDQGNITGNNLQLVNNLVVGGALTLIGTTTLTSLNVTGEASFAAGINVLANGLNVTGGLQVRTGGINVTNGGLNVSSGGLTVAGVGETVLDASGGARIIRGGLNITTVGLSVTGGNISSGIAVQTQLTGGLLVLAGLNVTSGGLTVSGGNLTVSGSGLTVSGGETVLSAAGGVRVSGGNLNVTANGVIISSGGLNVSAGGLLVSGGETIVSSAGGLRVTGGGVNITTVGLVVAGATNISGGLNVSEGLTVVNGGLNVSAGGIDVNTGGIEVKNGGLVVEAGGATVTGANMTVTGAGFVVGNLSLTALNSVHLDDGQAASNLSLGSSVFFVNGSQTVCNRVCSSHGLGCSGVLNLSVAGGIFEAACNTNSSGGNYLCLCN